MNHHRFVVNVRPTSWMGWIAVALLAVPLLALSFFFVAAALVLAALVLLVAFMRIIWYRHRGTASVRGHAVRRGDVIDIEPVDITQSEPAVTFDADVSSRPGDSTR